MRTLSILPHPSISNYVSSILVIEDCRLQKEVGLPLIANGCPAIVFQTTDTGSRKTYEMPAPYWSSLNNNEMGVAAKLNSVPKYVVSSTLQKAEWSNSTIIKDQVTEQIVRLKQQPGQEIQIEGSATLVESLTAGGLIDEYRFLVHPVIAGNGRRFFTDGMHTKGLKLVNTQTFGSGVILLCYQPV